MYLTRQEHGYNRPKIVREQSIFFEPIFLSKFKKLLDREGQDLEEVKISREDVNEVFELVGVDIVEPNLQEGAIAAAKK